MKIKRSQLQKIVREETIRHLVGLMEAGDAGVVDADEDNKKKDGEKKEKKPSSPNQPKKPSGEPKELPTGEEPADDELDDDPDVTTPDEDIAADSNGKGIGDKIVGKNILSFTTEPRPTAGKTELVFQFHGDPNPLRIIVYPDGKVGYAYKGEETDSLTGQGE